MREVIFCDTVDDDLLKFAVVVSRYEGKWVFCKQRGKNTYECPGGHRENGENIEETARRELYEETGAARFRLTPVSVYGVRENEEETTFGMLYFAEIQEFFALPDFEMERIEFFDGIPGELTYPDIQPSLIRKVQELL
jgi:8-oxo-dGTP diphosphatase